MGSGIGSSRTAVRMLNSLSSECNALEIKTRNIVNNLNSYFTGNAAEACKAALLRRISELKTMNNNARNIALRLNRAIQEVLEEEAEERRSRNSGGGGGGYSSGGPGMYL